jgi:hypothetical protein
MTTTLTPETVSRIHDLLADSPKGIRQLEFISDPAHGWLKVPHLAYQLAEAPASSHSYYDGETLDSAEYVYLEEDMDAPRFLDQVGITVRPDGGGLERDGGSWYIPSRQLQHQRRYDEVSPRDMKRLHDPDYVNPFAAQTPALFEAVKTPDGSTSVQLAKDQKFLDDHFQIIHIR